jgi:phosphoglucosamine mutase
MPKELFGTDGIRGAPGKFPLDARTLYALGRVLAAKLAAERQSPAVLIGMDTRESSERLAGWIAGGVTRAGSRAISAGVLPTPGVAHLVRANRFAAGIVISASHNPYTDNGVKLIASSGMKFPDAFEAEVEQDIGGERVSELEAFSGRLSPLPKSRAQSRDPGLEQADAPALRAQYLAHLRGRAIPGTRLAGMRIVIDCANGAASGVAPELFRSLGMEVVAIHDQPDGRNINAGCGSLHPESLREAVRARGAVLGAALDGDADRVIFVSASGRIVDGDGILLAMARHGKAHGWLKGGTVVGTVMANLGLERALAAEGLSLARVPVGDRYVLEEMLRLGANLGGEQSGHIIFLDEATTGDGLLTTLKMASLIALAGPLDRLVEGLEIFPQTILNVRVRAKPPLESLPAVARALDQARGALGRSGRIVLRYSGTEPLARVMVEAATEAEVARWSEAIAGAIRKSIGASE